MEMTKKTEQEEIQEEGEEEKEMEDEREKEDSIFPGLMKKDKKKKKGKRGKKFLKRVMESSLPIELADIHDINMPSDSARGEKSNRENRLTNPSRFKNSQDGEQKERPKIKKINLKTVKKMKKVLQLSWLRGAKFTKSQREKLEAEEKLESFLLKKYTENREKLNKMWINRLKVCFCGKKKEDYIVMKNPSFEELDQFMKMNYVHYRIFQSRKPGNDNFEENNQDSEKNEKFGVSGVENTQKVKNHLEVDAGAPEFESKLSSSTRSGSMILQSYFDKYGNEFSFQPYSMAKAVAEERTATFYHFLDSSQCFAKCKKMFSCKKNSKKPKKSSSFLTKINRSSSMAVSEKEDVKIADDESKKMGSFEKIKQSLKSSLRSDSGLDPTSPGLAGATVYDKFGPGVNLFFNFTNLTIFLLVVCSVLSLPLQYSNVKFFEKATNPNIKPRETRSYFEAFNAFLLSTTLGVSLVRKNFLIFKILNFFIFEFILNEINFLGAEFFYPNQTRGQFLPNRTRAPPCHRTSKNQKKNHFLSHRARIQLKLYVSSL